MKKTRELARDFGQAGDLRKLGTMSFVVSGYPETTIWAPWLSAGILLKHYEGMAAATGTISLPAYTGFESFDSSENRRPAFNNCRHFVNKLVNYPVTAWIKEPADPGTTLWWAYKYGRTNNYDGGTPYSSLPFLGDWSYASRRAWWEMQPRFEGEVSMLNFLFELKDFKDIAKAMSKVRHPQEVAVKMQNFLKKLRRLDKKDKSPKASVMFRASDTLESSLRLGAKTHLINEFALKPLVSDLVTVLGQAGKIVSDVQDEFAKRGLVAQKRHYSEVYNIVDTLIPYGGTSYIYSKGTFHKELFTATLEYKYKYNMRSRSEAFMKYWGLYPTQEALWNAVPFSFLVDYFYKVGNCFHAIETDPNVTLLALQYCESVLATKSSGTLCSGDARANMVVDKFYPAQRGTPIAAYTVSNYERWVKPPNKGFPLPKTKLPSGRQGVNMAALAAVFIK